MSTLIFKNYIKETISITNWSSYGDDEFIIRFKNGNEEIWIWTSELDRQEIVNNVHQLRNTKQQIKYLSNFAKPKPKPEEETLPPLRYKKPGFTCKNCGAQITGKGSSRCPNCEELL